MFRWLVNVGLLALPIAATLGILIALQTQRRITGQMPLFVPPLDDKVTYTSSCKKSFGIHPKTKGQEYTLNPNQWGWDKGDPGFLCMHAAEFNNRTYATAATAPQWNVSWLYPRETGSGNNVHAFPNIKVDGQVFPIGLGKLRQIGVDMRWIMRTNNSTSETDVEELSAAKVNANVAIDMFVDRDRSKAQDSTKAAYEIMVWFAAFGDSTHTVGQDDGVVKTMNLNGTNFNLYYGKNAIQQQNVLTWKAQDVTHDFHGDLQPLLDEILNSKMTGYPSPSDYLGYMSFGSEAYFSESVVTFSVPSLAIDVRKS